MLSVGCEEKEKRVYPTIASCDLVVVHHDGDGRLIDFVAFRDLGDAKLICVTPTPQNKDLFFVTIYGGGISQSLEPENASRSSSREGHRARIDIGIRNGKAAQVVADGKLSPTRVSDMALQIVDSFLVAGKDSFLKEPTIKVVKCFTAPVVKALEEGTE